MQVNDIYAKFGIKVDTESFKQASNTYKKFTKEISDHYKAITAESKAQLEAEKVLTQQSKTRKAAEQANTAEINKQTAAVKLQTAQQRLQANITKEKDRQEKNARREAEREEKESLRRRTQKYREFLSNVRKVALSVSASVYGIIKATERTRNEVLGMYRQAITLGINPQATQRYKAASLYTGADMSAEQIMGDVGELQNKLTSIRMGQASAKDLFAPRLLGIVDGASTATQVIERLRGAISGMDNRLATYFIKQMGLSENWLLILRQSKEEYESMSKSMLNDNQLERVARLGLGFKRLGLSVDIMKDQFTSFMSNALFDFIGSMRDAAEMVGRFFKRMDNPQGFATVMQWLTVIGMLIAPVTTRFLLLAVVAEDFFRFFTGKSSLIGEIVESFKKLGEGIKELDFEKIKEALKELGSQWKYLGVLAFVAFGFVGKAIGFVLSPLGGILKGVGLVGKGFLNLFKLGGAGVSWAATMAGGFTPLLAIILKITAALALMYATYKAGEYIGEKITGLFAGKQEPSFNMNDDLAKNQIKAIQNMSPEQRARWNQTLVERRQKMYNITNNLTVNADGRSLEDVDGLIESGQQAQSNATIAQLGSM